MWHWSCRGVFTYGIRALCSTLGPWVHYARHKIVTQLVNLCYLSWWHGLHGVSSSYDYCDIEEWDTPYESQDFGFTQHSFKICQNGKFMELLVICVP